MMRSDEKTVDGYLAALPLERREALTVVRKVILENLPAGYEEAMRWGMISYEIPLARYPLTHNMEPLGMAALASKKNYMSLYLMSVYGDKETEAWFRERNTAATLSYPPFYFCEAVMSKRPQFPY